MPQENVERLRTALAAYNTEGTDAIIDLLDPDVEWIADRSDGTDESSKRAAGWVQENVSGTVDPPSITEGSTVLEFLGRLALSVRLLRGLLGDRGRSESESLCRS
jgi:hypothetical protein